MILYCHQCMCLLNDYICAVLEYWLLVIINSYLGQMYYYMLVIE